MRGAVVDGMAAGIMSGFVSMPFAARSDAMVVSFVLALDPAPKNPKLVNFIVAAVPINWLSLFRPGAFLTTASKFSTSVIGRSPILIRKSVVRAILGIYYSPYFYFMCDLSIQMLICTNMWLFRM